VNQCLALSQHEMCSGALTLQAVTKCLSGVEQDAKQTCPLKVITALNHFIIPRSLWPSGLALADTLKRQYDLAAESIMDTVKADFARLAKKAGDFTEIRYYSVTATSEGVGVSTVAGSERNNIKPLAAPLERRLRRLAGADFFTMKFNQERDPYRSNWSFSVQIPVS